MEHFKSTSVEITDIWQSSCQYPDVTVNSKNEVFAVWEKYLDHTEVIRFAQMIDHHPHNEVQISGSGLALRPSLHTFNDRVITAWSEFENGVWKLCVREYQDGVFGAIQVIDEGEALFYPSVKDDGIHPVVVYNRQGVGFSDTIVATLGETVTLEKVNTAVKTYRPCFDHDGKGHCFVAYDLYNGVNYDVVVRAKIDGQWSEEVKLNQTAIYSTHPVMTRVGQKVTIAWYENGKHCYFSNNVIDVEVKDGQVVTSHYAVLTENRNWYNNIDITANTQGYTVVTYTWGKYNAIVRVRDLEGVWSEPVVITYNDSQCAVRPHIALDESNVLHYIWQFGNKNGHMHRYASIVYNEVALDVLPQFYDLEIEKKIDQFVQPIPAEKALDSRSEEEVAAWLKKNGYENLTLTFGDIHGQSNLSDALGEIDQYYHYAIKDANMDFCALTDHDDYPDIATDSEWEWNRTTRNLFNGEKNFAVLLAYEWTSNEYKHDFGHKNVYYPSSTGGLYRSTDPEGNNPTVLFASIKKDGGQCIPHHPAANWGLVSAATDWDYHDPEVQRVVEIFSRHADYEKFENQSKYTKNIMKFERHCAQDALARGYHLGFIAGSDSHQMEHGIEGGILGAFVPTLTSENVWNAIYNRFTYGTSGARILASLKIGSHHMGEEIMIPAGEAVKLDVSVLAVNEIRTVQIIKNNEVLVEMEGCGCAMDFTVEDSERGEEDFYYLRVEQIDDHCAWCSPIWVTRG